MAPAVAVLGPTASGKSDLALLIALTFRGEIVNCDSLQLYRHLNIGTAKLSVPEQRGIPHHLTDILNPDQIFTAGDYARAARRTLSEITGRACLPVIAGGTGFYLRALVDGLFDSPPRDDELRGRLARHTGSLHKMLLRWDPAAAARIHPNDTKKLIRALEVCILARRPISGLQPTRDRLKEYNVVKIGLDPPRTALHEKINGRCRKMFEAGLIEEVRSILALGFSGECKAFDAIGYREALAVIEGRMSREQAITATQLATRQYAKRQLTWFRREPGIHWLYGFGNQEETAERAIGLVKKFAGLKTRTFHQKPN